MHEITLDLLKELSVVPENCSRDLKDLFSGALEHTDLSITDYLTIRDLTAISGYDSSQVHALIMLMFLALRQGSVCLRIEEEAIQGKLALFAGKRSGALAKKIESDIINYPKLIHYIDLEKPGLFNDPGEAFKPLILTIVGESRLLYFQKYFLSERNLFNHLSRFLKSDQLLIDDKKLLADAVDFVLNRKPVRFHGNAVNFNIQQKIGMVLPALKNLVIISGGPGTGKTSIALNCVRILTRIGISAQRIRVAAPTGRAAQRLADSIHRGLETIDDRDTIDDDILSLQGTTIHRLLDYSPSRNTFMYNRYRKIGADAIIIDEASMVDITLLGRLFEALESFTRVVLLGDRDQLPSVDAGAMLAYFIPEQTAARYSKPVLSILQEIVADDAIPHEKNSLDRKALVDRVVILEESYRSEAKISEAADLIKCQDLSVFESIPECVPHALPERGIWRVKPAIVSGGIGGYRKLLSQWIEVNYLRPGKDDSKYEDLVSHVSNLDLSKVRDEEAVECLDKIFAVIEAARILTPIRHGLYGTAGINAYTIELIATIFDPGSKGGHFSGVPVLIARNDYRLGLFNGDVGVILKGRDHQYYGIFRQTERYISYPVESLPPHELSFAITVHKSQGSEYSRILLMLPEGMPDILQTKEILYTAITRARDLAIIFSSADLFTHSLQNRIERESGIVLA